MTEKITPTSNPQIKQLSELRKSWGWFMVIGALITLCGSIAAIYLVASSVAAAIILGSLLFVGGVLQILFAFQVNRIQKLFWGWLISGILFLLACFITFAFPTQTLIAITLLIALSLGASGIARVIAGIQSKGLDGWVWFIVSGVIGILAAVFIAGNLRTWAFLLPGLFLAIDLLFQGLSMMMFGLTLKRALQR